MEDKIPTFFRTNTSFDSFKEYVKDKAPCALGLEWITENAQSKSFKEAIEEFLIDDKADYSWLAWWFQNHYYVWGSTLRERILQKIDSPMFAFSLYLNNEHLSRNEDIILENIFKGKLAREERELKDGTVKRKKL